MTGLLIVPTILSMLLLAAYYLRAGNLLLVLICVGSVFLLMIPRWWARRLMQVLLVLAAIDWFSTLLLYVRTRQQAGQPVEKIVAVLGGVAAFALVAALLLEARPIRKRYA